MSKTNVGVINCAIYENGVEYLGIASVTLPTLSAKTLGVTGVGIGGDLDIPVIGNKGAMSVTIKFTDAPEGARKIVSHGTHILDCRVAHENFDSTAGRYEVTGHKYVLTVLPKSETLGDIAPAAQQGVSDEFSCLCYKEYIDGALVRHYDPINCIDIDANGVDSFAAVRNALGK